MKSIDGPSIRKKLYFSLLLMVVSLMIGIGSVAYHKYRVYQSIHVVVHKTATLEYGSANYDVNQFIQKVEGKIVSIEQDIQPDVLGKQEIVLKVQKENFIKDVSFVVEVVDCVAPVISLKEETLSITEGDTIDLLANVSSVTDSIDGDISYIDSAKDSSHYSIEYTDDLNTVGSHLITVDAIDRFGNRSTKSFTLQVNAKPSFYPISYDVPANPNGEYLASVARSLLGSPYVSAGAGPYGFDCSGFVSYLYSLIGVSIGRSTYDQQFVGYGVSYEDMKPGDILVWGYVDGQPTHSAMYVGDGCMIHAANQNEGVIISNISFWLSGSGTHILTIRRIL